MNPIIGIVACGSTDQRQFVPQTYISAIEDAGGIPVILPCTKEDEAYPHYGKICDGFLFCGGDDVSPLLSAKNYRQIVAGRIPVRISSTFPSWNMPSRPDFQS